MKKTITILALLTSAACITPEKLPTLYAYVGIEDLKLENAICFEKEDSIVYRVSCNKAYRYNEIKMIDVHQKEFSKKDRDILRQIIEEID